MTETTAKLQDLPEQPASSISESSKMLQLMNVVLSSKEAKERASKHFKRKRDEKLRKKEGNSDQAVGTEYVNGNGGARHGKLALDDRPLVD